MSVLSRKYGLKDSNFSTARTETSVSKRLPETYETAAHQVENVQAQKLRLGMVQHRAETGNGTRHLQTGSEMKIHQIMVPSADTPIQSGDILKLSEEEICKQYKLDPVKIKTDLEHLFSNLSDVVNILAPDFYNKEPSLSNLLFLICRIKDSFDKNTITFGNKSLMMFDYFLAVTDQSNFDMQSDKIVISVEKNVIVEPFGNLKIDLISKHFCLKF